MQAEADFTAHRLLEVDRPCICPLPQSQLKHQNQPDQSLQLLFYVIVVLQFYFVHNISYSVLKKHSIFLLMITV